MQEGDILMNIYKNVIIGEVKILRIYMFGRIGHWGNEVFFAAEQLVRNTFLEKKPVRSSINLQPDRQTD